MRITGYLIGAVSVAVLAACGSTAAAKTAGGVTTSTPTTHVTTTTTSTTTTTEPIHTATSAPPGTAQAVPNVTGKELDLAEATLLAAGLGYEVFGGGTFGVVIASDWTVCSQSPSPGTIASALKLVVARSC